MTNRLVFCDCKNRKSMSAVVATALLLVVAVVAVIGFQDWFLMYSSNVFSEVETSSYNDVSSFGIETVVGNVLYLKNVGSDFTIKDIKIDGVSCYDNDTVYEKGIFEIDVSLCLENVSRYDPEILIVTDKGLIEKKIYYKPKPKTCSVGSIVLESQTSQTFYKYNKPYNSLEGCLAISQERTCVNGVLDGSSEYSYLSCNDSLAPTNGGEWVLVFANEDLGINNDFYVMKYEAKFADITLKTQDMGGYRGWQYSAVAGNMSVASSFEYEPITYVSQTEAISACSALGPGYKLISRSEWVAIGREIEEMPENWDSEMVGNGLIYRGHSDNVPGFVLAVTNTNDFFDGTGNSGTSDQRRVLVLKNGEHVWDIGGNVWEWNSDTYNNNVDSSLGKVFSWYEWTQISSDYDHLKPSNKSLTSANGIGKILPDDDSAQGGGNIHAFLSGGGSDNVVSAGAFGLRLDMAPSLVACYIGFRCTYDP